LAILPNAFYNLPGNQEPETIESIVYGNQDPSDIDSRVQIIGQQAKTYHINTPRYKQFTQIALKLIAKGMKFIDIAGQKFIQVKVKTDQDLTDVPIGHLLYDYSIVPNQTVRWKILDVPVEQLNEL